MSLSRDTNTNMKITLEELKQNFIQRLKDGEIKIKDVPKEIRDDVIKETFGRYPLKNFKDLTVIYK